MSAAKSPWSTARRSSDMTWRMAVSVEWPGRKPDCRDGRKLADVRMLENVTADGQRDVRAASIILTGWRLAGMSLHRQSLVPVF